VSEKRPSEAVDLSEDRRDTFVILCLPAYSDILLTVVFIYKSFKIHMSTDTGCSQHA